VKSPSPTFGLRPDPPLAKSEKLYLIFAEVGGPVDVRKEVAVAVDQPTVLLVYDARKGVADNATWDRCYDF
jgi:hypothetical protein